MQKFILPFVAFALLGAGCTPQNPFTTASNDSLSTYPPQAEQTTTANTFATRDTSQLNGTEYWMIRNITNEQIEYAPIDWYEGNEAVAEAEKDGADAYGPGFYWRYHYGPDATFAWPVSNANAPEVELICNGTSACETFGRDKGYQTMNYYAYLEAYQVCKTGPVTECIYYNVGAGSDLFTVTFEDGKITEMREKYLP